MNARQIFIQAYGSKSRNFMTPNRIELKSLVRGVAAYELSCGRGFRDNIIYGVSVAALVDGQAVRGHTPIGGCFDSLRKARSHIGWLQDNWTDDLDTLKELLEKRGW